MPFRTLLKVAHTHDQDWRLLQPLVWEGDWQYVVIRSGFQTDFASIPKPVRWLLDNAGRNAEAAVLHDAAWRESKSGAGRRIDPWYVDGMFRRALRETGAPALTRGLMWFAVRMAAMAGGRFGKRGPGLLVKLFHLLVMLVLGVLSALGPTVVAALGLLVYLGFSWLVAVVWHLAFERGHGWATNWPWPRRVDLPPTAVDAVAVPQKEQPASYLVVLPFTVEPDVADPITPTAAQLAVVAELRTLLAEKKVPPEATIDRWVTELAGDEGDDGPLAA